jgi:hypothetical protein
MKTFPYSKYEKTLLWETIEKSINDLIENQDIELTTAKKYVVGYLCEKISNHNVKPNVDARSTHLNFEER